MIFHSQSTSRVCFLGRRCFEHWVGEVLHRLGASSKKRVLIAHIKPRGFIPKDTLGCVKMVVLITVKV